MLTLALAAALLAEPTATPVTLPSEPAPLHGTLLTPQGPTRAVAVIIAGSGPTDRDGNSPMGVTAATYRLLAEGLAERGIATVRYDKRGVAQSAPAATAEADLRFDHMAEDARGWARLTTETTGQPYAWLIGHSEGALVAQVAANGTDGVCGLVLLSGAGRPAGAVIREQLATVPEPLKTQAFDALAELEAGRTTEGPPALAALFRPSVQPYLISWLPLDPAALLAAYDGPVLIGQGSTDIQTGAADAQALAAAQPNARFVTWDGVNHVLKAAPADRTANAATYGDASLPLGPGVVDTVADVILEP
jgi:pimeloyl-ACP methyl ester carboxylesterase